MAADGDARRRILDATVALASAGGYDAVQVRALAARARVSSRTIYAHFPSLDSLLIVAVAEQSAPLYRRFTRATPTGRTPAVRLHRLVEQLSATMTANRPLTVALLRALLSGKADVAQHVDGFGQVLRRVLASTIAPEGPTAREREIAEILQGVWFSALIGWATGSDDAAAIGRIMDRAARRLLASR